MTLSSCGHNIDLKRIYVEPYKRGIPDVRLRGSGNRSLRVRPSSPSWKRLKEQDSPSSTTSAQDDVVQSQSDASSRWCTEAVIYLRRLCEEEGSGLDYAALSSAVSRDPQGVVDTVYKAFFPPKRKNQRGPPHWRSRNSGELSYARRL